jgi:3-deoxy-D-manno-octulosonic acid (KDO) 8-phosphate synthase
MNKNKAHFDARHPVQQSLGFRDVAAGRQKMVSMTALQLAATYISSVILSSHV